MATKKIIAGVPGTGGQTVAEVTIKEDTTLAKFREKFGKKLNIPTGYRATIPSQNKTVSPDDNLFEIMKDGEKLLFTAQAIYGAN